MIFRALVPPEKAEQIKAALTRAWLLACRGATDVRTPDFVLGALLPESTLLSVDMDFHAPWDLTNDDGVRVENRVFKFFSGLNACVRKELASVWDGAFVLTRDGKQVDEHFPKLLQKPKKST